VTDRQLLGAAPATLLVLGVTGAGIAWTFLGSFGLVKDFGKPEFTTSYYMAVLPAALRATVLSVLIASISTLVAATIGVIAAFVLQERIRANRFLSSAITMTVPIPHLMAALAIDLLLGDAGWLARLFNVPAGAWPQFVAGRWWLAVILEYSWKESAFIALVVLATLPNTALRLQTISKTLGASPLNRLKKVFIPLAAPGLIAGAGLSFIYAVSSYEVSWLLGRTYPEPLSILAFRLFSSTDLAVRPQAMAASVVALIVSLLAASMTILMLRNRRFE
jgi:putative spermidine/putrescine transport system permease protein